MTIRCTWWFITMITPLFYAWACERTHERMSVRTDPAIRPRHLTPPLDPPNRSRHWNTLRLKCQKEDQQRKLLWIKKIIMRFIVTWPSVLMLFIIQNISSPRPLPIPVVWRKQAFHHIFQRKKIPHRFSMKFGKIHDGKYGWIPG